MLTRTIKATFRRRKTEIPRETPLALNASASLSEEVLPKAA
jgi:hypothetical protein